MAAVSPSLLSAFSRMLEGAASQRRTAKVIRLLARTRVPMLATERIAARRPDAGLEGRAGGSALMAAHAEERHSALEAPGEGPLAGERVAVKDSIDVAGARTGFGLRDGGDVAPRDAEIVARVRRAGGALLGKARMTELGLDGLGALMPGEMPENPRAPGYFPGGSSTGTAVAVASGVARYGIGGDGMGSIRIPAAYCGLVGLKPTHDRLPIDGYPSVAPSMDVPGPMARTAADCALLWQVLAGEPVVPLSPRVPARIGVMRQLGPERASRSVAAAFDRALRGLGARVDVADVPGAEHAVILGFAAAAHEVARSAHATRRLSGAGQLTLAFGRAVTVEDAEHLASQRARLRAAVLSALDGAAVLAMPTSAVPAPAVTRSLLAGGQDGVLLRAVGAYTPLANCTGLPAIAVPCGVDDRGRPLSIMFLGPPGSETALLEIALAVEALGLTTAPL